MFRGIFLALVLLGCAFAVLSPAYAEEKRLALVLSNQDYPDTIGRLAMTHSDGDGMAKALEGVRFKVTRGRDLNAREMRSLMNAFFKAIDDEAVDGDDVVAFVYLSMHGAAAEVDGSTRNFLIPAKEEIATQFDLIDRGMRLDALINGLAATKAKAVTIV